MAVIHAVVVVTVEFLLVPLREWVLYSGIMRFGVIQDCRYFDTLSTAVTLMYSTVPVQYYIRSALHPTSTRTTEHDSWINGLIFDCAFVISYVQYSMKIQ